MGTRSDASTSSVRPPAVAGLFYPADPERLRRDVGALLADEGSARKGPRPATPLAAEEALREALPPKVLIVPHAGYVYSGPVAARAYGRLASVQHLIRRVVLLGPAHRVWLDGMALPASTAFETPLGRVPLDTASISRLSGLPRVRIDDGPHGPEHSLEVQLPFLQVALDEFVLVPIVVGDCPPTPVAAVIDAAWGGPETLILVSSDLSHFLDYRTARRIDRQTRDKILGRCTTLTGDEACGARAINGLMRSTAAEQLAVEAIDLRSSGDTAGDRERVVGYGSFALR